MIVAERKMQTLDYLDKFGIEMQDGRLTEPSDGKIYKLREVILASKKLGFVLYRKCISFYAKTEFPQ